MEQDKDKRMILRLLLEDLNDLENRQKGKGTDLDVALASLRDDIRALQVSIEEETLALSTSTAVATDQKILAALQHEERVATQDHQFALALHNGTSTSDRIQNDTTPPDDNDAVSIVMGDLMSRVALKEDSALIHPPQKSSVMRKCASCFTKVDTIMFKGSCGHEFCRDCTRQMFLGAIKDEELYPPRCCGNVAPPGVALRILNYEELQRFCERALEWTAKDRLYCAEPKCSKFIPPFAIQNEHGTCPECHRQTHVICRSLTHPRVDCPMDESLHAVLALAEAENWKRCFNCRTMVELRHGCNHMTCRCGREFCYVCGLVWKSCECALWHENRLEEVAVQAVDEEAPANADIHVRRNLFHRIVDGLRRHEDNGVRSATIICLSTFSCAQVAEYEPATVVEDTD
ncbi:hypothetical protein PENNAL_c0031G04048 [Penicillium nalgiovense]|uniref:RBR-type E3 ubiquitin transferase n=1 Tax=Penicillium nalgiovense TaxID=60175 RepID=A0A1V6Y8I0_PENNA|nr:hypothetical protein PENNAL_c0031G04048 [Penicillium nalgiovense]